MAQATFEDVAEFVAHECGVPREEISPASRIQADLGITGDDAAELMAKFARRFDVDLRTFEFYRHFGPEGCLPGIGIYHKIRYGYSLDEHEVTIAMLVDATQRGRWPDFASSDRQPNTR